MIVKLLRTTDWSAYRRSAVLEHAQYKADAANIKIAYKTPLNELKAIDVNTLERWVKKYKSQYLNSDDVLCHPLNFLYETVFGRRDGKRELDWSLFG